MLKSFFITKVPSLYIVSQIITALTHLRNPRNKKTEYRTSLDEQILSNLENNLIQKGPLVKNNVLGINTLSHNALTDFFEKHTTKPDNGFPFNTGSSLASGLFSMTGEKWAWNRPVFPIVYLSNNNELESLFQSMYPTLQQMFHDSIDANKLNSVGKIQQFFEEKYYNAMLVLIFGVNHNISLTYNEYLVMADSVTAMSKGSATQLTKEAISVRTKMENEFKENLNTRHHDCILPRLDLSYRKNVNDNQLTAFLMELFSGGICSTSALTVNALYGHLTTESNASIQKHSTWKSLDKDAAIVAYLAESGRFCSPAPMVLRHVDDTLDSKNGKVTLQPTDNNPNVVVTNRIPHLNLFSSSSESKHAFDAQQWTPQRIKQCPFTGSDAYWPFGLGPRRCGGMEVALFLAKSFFNHSVHCNPKLMDNSINQSLRYGCAVPLSVRIKLNKSHK
jgi:hypothetical protein